MCNLPTDEGAFSVVGDANFFFYLLEALINAVENDSPGLSRDEMFDRFIERLHRVLEGAARKATAGKLLISSSVYQEELCLTNRGSSLRRKLGCVDTVCASQREKYEALDQCLLDHLMVVHVPGEDVQSLVQYFHEPLRPKDRDASLLMLALRQCGGAQTFLLTDDTGLAKACDHVVRRGQIIFACGTFETGQLDHVRYMDFLKWAHDQCFVRSEDFRSCFNFKLAIEYERIDRVGPSGRRLVQKKLDKATDAFLSSVMAKAQSAGVPEPPQAL